MIVGLLGLRRSTQNGRGLLIHGGESGVDKQPLCFGSHAGGGKIGSRNGVSGKKQKSTAAFVKAFRQNGR